METLKNALNNFADGVSESMPKTIGAILVLIIGFFIASMIKKCLAKVLNKFKIDDKIKQKSGMESKLEDLLASLGYFTIIVFTALLELDILGIQGVLDPVKNMIYKFLDIIPNIVASGLIIFMGYILAQICSAGTIFISSPLDKHVSKIGLSQDFKLSVVLAKIVSIIIYIPIAVAALDTLKIEAISEPAQSMLSELINAVPNILAATIILLVAFFLGKLVTGILADFLKSVDADKIPEKLNVDKLFSEKYTFSKIISCILFFYIMLGAVVAAVEKLELPAIENLVSNFIVFFSQITIGIVILGIGSLITNALFSIAEGEKKSFNMQLAKFAVHGLVIAMGLSAMGVADSVVNMAFGFTFGAIAVAFALAFGLGGKEAAGKQMEDFFLKIRGK